MAPQQNTIEFDHLGIGTALKRNQLSVPLNQREYSWERKHVLDLFHDFAKAIGDGKASYFLGTIVLTVGKDDKWDVADGQQRLATSTILLGAVRDYFFREGDDLLVDSIEQDLLFAIDRDARAIVPRLTLNVQDNEFFRKRILSRPDAPDRDVQAKKDSHEKIEDAAKLAAKHIMDIVTPHALKNRTAQLNRWVKFVQDAAQIVLLKVPDDLNAFVMFETLNDRGLKTSQSDLLKNYLFSEAGDRIAEAQEKWASMKGALESLGDDEVMITYLRHLAISLYGHTRERDVFEKKGRSRERDHRSASWNPLRTTPTITLLS